MVDFSDDLFSHMKWWYGQQSNIKFHGYRQKRVNMFVVVIHVFVPEKILAIVNHSFSELFGAYFFLGTKPQLLIFYLFLAIELP